MIVLLALVSTASTICLNDSDGFRPGRLEHERLELHRHTARRHEHVGRQRVEGTVPQPREVAGAQEARQHDRDGAALHGALHASDTHTHTQGQTHTQVHTHTCIDTHRYRHTQGQTRTHIAQFSTV